MDIFDPMTRSRIMSRIGSRHTKPEKAVAKELRERGLKGWRRYRKVDGIELDFVWSRQRIAVNVNGCFWHGHDCDRAGMPKSRRSFWRSKLEGNVERDARQLEILTGNGWTVFVVWECWLKDAPFAETMDLLQECLEARG